MNQKGTMKTILTLALALAAPWVALAKSIDTNIVTVTRIPTNCFASGIVTNVTLAVTNSTHQGETHTWIIENVGSNNVYLFFASAITTTNIQPIGAPTNTFYLAPLLLTNSTFTLPPEASYEGPLVPVVTNLNSIGFIRVTRGIRLPVN